MDSLQKQINALSVKVDALHQVIEQLGANVTQVVSDIRTNPNQGMDGAYRGDLHLGRYSATSYASFNAAMEHKDVLSDSNYLNGNDDHGGERELSPEIQIRRLTAQLTAAYNRIAALEEQLLAKRSLH